MMLVALTATACLTPVIHDYYLFSVYHRDLNADFEKRCNQNWAAYTQGKVTCFDYEALLKYTQQKKDAQMTAYVKRLNQYVNGICSEMGNPWYYPSKEEINQNKAQLRTIRTQSQAALQTRLRSQNALMVMRCNMMLEQHEANIAFWKEWEGKLPNSVYRDMMRNIYAGALCHTGRQDEACQIFAEQGDMTSIRFCMYDNLTYAGIKKVFERNPNAASLPWLVQTYVNDAQTVLGNMMYSDEDTQEQIQLNKQYRNDVTNFIALANKAVATSQTPVLWKTAAAWMEFMYGDHKKAQKYIDEAVNMEGTPRMKDNARAIRFFITAANANKSSEKFDNYVAQELKWLEQMDKQDCQEETCWSTHYREVADRVIFEVLTDKYDQWKRPEIANALVGALPSQRGEYDSFNPHYSDFYFWRLDTLSGTDLEKYLVFTQQQQKGQLEQYLLSRTYTDKNFLTDLTGTRYLAEGNWKKAISFLQQVPLSFLDQQNICEYMNTRSYTTEQWMKSQLKSMSDQRGLTHLKRNMKLDFAREINQMEGQLSVAKNEKRQQLAYDIAVRLFQASYLGDCWFLTRYGHSVADEARKNEKDFVALAQQYLETASQSNQFLLKEKALYALGYIPTEPWQESVWDDQKMDYVLETRPNSSQYKALTQLTELYKKHPMSNYVSKCDVLKAFLKQQ